MEINFSQNEYRDLLDIFSLASWILHAFKIEEDPRTESYRKLEQKILSYAKEMGFDHLIQYDNELKKYLPTKEYEENSMDQVFIEEFEEDTFWDELIHRLTMRDLVNLVGGVEELSKMNLIERLTKEDPIEKAYSKEFEENGLKNLKIVKNR